MGMSVDEGGTDMRGGSGGALGLELATATGATGTRSQNHHRERRGFGNSNRHQANHGWSSAPASIATVAGF
jgi:hypothetical protein